MRDLSRSSTQVLKDFFNSFDYILSDVDGVLWNVFDEIPGTVEAIKSLRNLGKKIVFVSNNTSKSLRIYSRQLKKAGFDVEEDDIVTPALAMISYLKKQDLTDKTIFVLGMTSLKEQLKEAGYQLAENAPDRIPETIHDVATHAIVDDGSVGCVIADVDINLNYINLQKATTFLERPEVLFLMGATDVKLPLGLNRVITGPGYFHKILEDMTGREAIKMAKPSSLLNDYIVEKYGIRDASRVLFIGDSISEDIRFGARCNYKTLLVLSGLTKKEAVENWTYPDECKPDYYVDSLGVLQDLIKRIWRSKL